MDLREKRKIFVRRVRDISFVLAVMPLLLPLIVVIALLIIIKEGWPPFFIQERVGKGGQIFKIWKFRTMVIEAPVITEDPPMEKDQRITSSGFYLRKWKLDELPQLLQVLSGTMTLIGMRGEMNHTDRIARYHPLDWEKRKSFSPGIFCVSQLFDGVPMYHRKAVMIDIRYLEKSTIWSDFKLMVQLALRLMGIMECPIKKAAISRATRLAQTA